MKTDRESELETCEQQRVGVVKHARILALRAHWQSANRGPCGPVARYGYLFGARGCGVVIRAYWLDKQRVTHQGNMKNLIDAAIETGNFNTLLSAFKSASLIDMLRSPGQYTIFAPTDAAFKRLPAGSLDALFKDARTLKPFICNHIMSGVKAANDILPGELKPLEGETLRASLHGSAVHINGATIVQADIHATNGVIHAIDEVLVPLNPILAAVA